MYGVASHYLGDADQLPIVRVIGDYEIWVALAAWAVTAVVMLVHLSRTGARRAHGSDASRPA